jgi:hypothetical protein
MALSKFPYDQAKPHIDMIKSRVDAVMKAAQEPQPAEGENQQ